MHIQQTRERVARKQDHKQRIEHEVWTVLQSTAMTHMAELMATIHTLAPKPGSLVVLDVRPLPLQWDNWQPVLFSATDLCTHLQIARMYITCTPASAVDFLQFVMQRYPFSITEIRTGADPVFVNTASLQSKHLFTSEVKRHRIAHSVVLNTSEQPALHIASKYNYGGTLNATSDDSSKDTIMNGLVSFLFFHNNHRSLAPLGGLTPLQKLNSFAGYERISWFDPYVPHELRKASNG
ncbi:MAG: hypothetical protein L0Y80_05840 [Ignavibacteriae bacterium]|nr:hypothetical protein [Ignavibacteriota bacterium]